MWLGQHVSCPFVKQTGAVLVLLSEPRQEVRQFHVPCCKAHLNGSNVWGQEVPCKVKHRQNGYR